MAVAGGTASSIEIALVDGKLKEGAVMHRPWSLLATDVDEALAALGRAGSRRSYLALQGYNLPCLREVLEPSTLSWRVVWAIVRSIVTGA